MIMTIRLESKSKWTRAQWNIKFGYRVKSVVKDWLIFRYNHIDTSRQKPAVYIGFKPINKTTFEEKVMCLMYGANIGPSKEKFSMVMQTSDWSTSHVFQMWNQHRAEQGNVFTIFSLIFAVDLWLDGIMYSDCNMFIDYTADL